MTVEELARLKANYANLAPWDQELVDRLEREAKDRLKHMDRRNHEHAEPDRR